mmetsp:Transcript_6942/g.7123  ORF Transcript_6942/g.7123 Transcript_6942/m.7123 type:complete len:86 (+) Transcript_6942:259-516(+)
MRIMNYCGMRTWKMKIPASSRRNRSGTPVESHTSDDRIGATLGGELEDDQWNIQARIVNGQDSRKYRAIKYDGYNIERRNIVFDN